MDSTGTMSNRGLYLNWSNYAKPPGLQQKNLDAYLADCGNLYTSRTLEVSRIYCSEGLIFLEGMGVHTISDITYEAVIKLVETKMYCSDDTKVMIPNNTAHITRFYGEKGLCSLNYSLVLNRQIYPHIELVSQFSVENCGELDKIMDVTLSVDEVYKSIICGLL
ncbi:hypothetical protein EDD74_10390 [Faecalimonas umbilicata]|uniref:Uncharacterized protein n=1 Tax=Faecalimonas umbilicata TaxID=1912855 RepID=A0A4R3JTL7_9FIRM|nr:hypothetical protein [Faecalimonas umbilicata]TCS69640.1 hypothetical protein EDD74_10390 [Faecalimonas umbilicata]GBU05947.1 hypothetical protein FAEUMB_24880 [Faecalimonas umbilicata]